MKLLIIYEQMKWEKWAKAHQLTCQYDGQKCRRRRERMSINFRLGMRCCPAAVCVSNCAHWHARNAQRRMDPVNQACTSDHPMAIVLADVPNVAARRFHFLLTDARELENSTLGGYHSTTRFSSFWWQPVRCAHTSVGESACVHLPKWQLVCVQAPGRHYCLTVSHLSMGQNVCAFLTSRSNSEWAKWKMARKIASRQSFRLLGANITTLMAPL